MKLASIDPGIMGAICLFEKIEGSLIISEIIGIPVKLLPKTKTVKDKKTGQNVKKEYTTKERK